MSKEPERPAGLPEAFEWSRDAWVANTDDAAFLVEQRGGRWDAWERHSCVTVLTMDTPRDALTDLLGRLEAAAAPHVERLSALRALLGEPEAEEDTPDSGEAIHRPGVAEVVQAFASFQTPDLAADVERLTRERDEARAEVERLRGLVDEDERLLHEIRENLPEYECDADGNLASELERVELAGQEIATLRTRAEKAEAGVERLTRSRDGWESDALTYAKNAEHWEGRAEKAKAERDALVAAIQPFISEIREKSQTDRMDLSDLSPEYHLGLTISVSESQALLAAAKAVRS